MAYFIDLFSPETYEAFKRSNRDVSGFRLRHKNMADRVKPGDTLVCYLTRLNPIAAARGGDLVVSKDTTSTESLPVPHQR
jgi:hypothetical protein